MSLWLITSALFNCKFTSLHVYHTWRNDSKHRGVKIEHSKNKDQKLVLSTKMWKTREKEYNDRCENEIRPFSKIMATERICFLLSSFLSGKRTTGNKGSWFQSNLNIFCFLWNMFSRQNCGTLSCCHRDELSANEVTVCNFTHQLFIAVTYFTRRERVFKADACIVVSTTRNDCYSSTCSPILSSESEAEHYSKSFSL